MNDKFPRIFHAPNSPGLTRGDKRIGSLEQFKGKDILITEKLDGSNVCLTSREVFARSHAKLPTHISFDMLKAVHARVRSEIPNDVSIFGEWLFAKHSILYETLPNYLMIFAVRVDFKSGMVWASWDETRRIAFNLGLEVVPTLVYACSPLGITSASHLEALLSTRSKGPSAYGQEKEGCVARIPGVIPDKMFSSLVVKYVRAHHVKTDEHWSHAKLIKNKLAK